MRTRRASVVFFIACLLGVGCGSAAMAGSASADSGTDAGSLTVEVADLVGMEGLELAAIVWRGTEGDLFHVPIDAPVFTASDRLDLWPGTYYLWVLAGEAPCAVGFIPYCGPDQEVSDYFCTIDFDVLPGEHIRIGIAGLPATDAGRDEAACPVTHVLRQPS